MFFAIPYTEVDGWFMQRRHSGCDWALVGPFCFGGPEQAGCPAHAFFRWNSMRCPLCAGERFGPNDHIKRSVLLDVHAALRGVRGVRVPRADGVARLEAVHPPAHAGVLHAKEGAAVEAGRDV